MKKNFSFLYLLPQLFFTGLFLLALFLGLWDSFTVEGHVSIAHYKEIFTRGDTLPSIFYTLRISFLSSLFTLLLAILCSFLILHFSENWDSLKSILQLAIIMPHSLVALFLLFFLSQNGFMARIFYALKLISDQSAFPEFVYDRFGVGVRNYPLCFFSLYRSPIRWTESWEKPREPWERVPYTASFLLPCLYPFGSTLPHFL